jgi:hypothetical protein
MADREVPAFVHLTSKAVQAAERIASEITIEGIDAAIARGVEASKSCPNIAAEFPVRRRALRCSMTVSVAEIGRKDEQDVLIWSQYLGEPGTSRAITVAEVPL